MNEQDDIEEEDDILEEIHRIREAIWEKAGGTPSAYVRYYIELDKKRLAEEKAAQEPKPKRVRRIPKIAVRKSGKPANRRRKVAVL